METGKYEVVHIFTFLRNLTEYVPNKLTYTKKGSNMQNMSSQLLPNHDGKELRGETVSQ